MSIFNFISKIRGETKRTNIEDDLSYTKKIFDDISLPMLQAAKNSFDLSKSHSDYYEQAKDIFYHNTKLRETSLMGDMEILARSARNNLNFVEKQVQATVEDSTYSDAINLRQAQLFQAAAAFAMIADGIVYLVNFLMRAEEISHGGEGELTKTETKEFEDKVRLLSKLLSNYGTEERAFEKLMEKVPDALVTKKNMSQVQAAFAKDGDPFNGVEVANGFIPHPVFFAREVWANICISRYEASKLEKKKFELLVLALKGQMSQNPSANIEKQIQYYDNQIEKLRDKIEAFETKYR